MILLTETAPMGYVIPAFPKGNSVPAHPRLDGWGEGPDVEVGRGDA